MPDRQPSPLATRVKLRMDAMQINQRAVQRKCRLNHGFISDLLRGAKQDVNDEALDRIARALETSTEFLRGHTDDPMPLMRPPAKLVRRPIPRLPASVRIAALLARATTLKVDETEATVAADPEPPSTASDEDDEDFYREETPLPPLPVGFMLSRLCRIVLLTPASERKKGGVFRAPLRLLKADDDGGVRIADGLAMRTLPRPPSTYAMPDAYAVEWPDNRLTPRIRAGETIVVAPSLYPRAGRDVIVVERGIAGAPPIVTIAGKFAEACHEHVLIEPYDHGPLQQVKCIDIQAIHAIVAILIDQ